MISESNGKLEEEMAWRDDWGAVRRSHGGAVHGGGCEGQSK